MTEGKINVLFIHGIRDNGTVDVIQASSLGRIMISTDGSCNVSGHLPEETVNVSHFAIDFHPKQEISLKHILKHDLVFCEISDPDSHSVALKKAQFLYDALKNKIPWINNPYKVLNTRREKVPELLRGIEAVVAPRTLRIKPGSTRDIREAIEASGLSLPVLLRPAGSHGGKNLILIKTYAELDSLDLWKYAEAFVTEFIDVGDNGIYSKYRFAVVGGNPLLRHRLSNDHWMVHSAARAYTSSRPELQKNEAEALANFDQDLKLIIQDPIRKIHEKIGLDYFGIDCAISNGELILFEVNANMNIMMNNQPLPNIWEEAIDRIRNAVMERLIVPRAKRAA